jgi:hypothetical protein
VSRTIESGRPVIIAGMHRSGTSLTARFLGACGVHLGERLLEGNAGNPHGHFEDLEILDFHEGVLARRRLTWLVTGGDLPLQVTAKERAEAERLAAERSVRPLWGWKEPRTTLLLDLWAEVLPRAVFLLMFRHPFAVLDSLLRRQDPQVRKDPVRGLRSWVAYNEAALAFAGSQPERCCVVSLAELVRVPGAFRDELNVRFGLGLEPVRFEDAYVSRDLRPSAPLRPRWLWARHPGVVAKALNLHRRLLDAASQPLEAG